MTTQHEVDPLEAKAKFGTFLTRTSAEKLSRLRIRIYNEEALPKWLEEGSELAWDVMAFRNKNSLSDRIAVPIARGVIALSDIESHTGFASRQRADQLGISYDEQFAPRVREFSRGHISVGGFLLDAASEGVRLAQVVNHQLELRSVRQ
jgi:hypothetical protein